MIGSKNDIGTGREAGEQCIFTMTFTLEERTYYVSHNTESNIITICSNCTFSLLFQINLMLEISCLWKAEPLGTGHYISDNG